MIKKEIKKDNYYKALSINEKNEDQYYNFREYQIIDGYKFYITRVVYEKMDLNDADIDCIKISNENGITTEKGFSIRFAYYDTDANKKMDFSVVNVDIVDKKTTQNHVRLYGKAAEEAIKFVLDMYEQYSSRLNLSEESMKLYAELTSKLQVVDNYAI